MYSTDRAAEAEARDRANALMPAAQMALDDTGLQVAMDPPPMFGGPRRHGLHNVAFVNEQPGWGGGFGGGLPPNCQLVRDAMGQCISYLTARETATIEARRRPTYWGDRFLRAVLGFPAYLVEVVSGRSRWEVEGSSVGAPLRGLGGVLGGVAALATIAATGRLFGWW